VARIICDSDLWAYQNGGATQRTIYDWAVIAGDDVVGSGVATTKEELEGIRATVPAGGRLEMTESIDADPLSHALALTKRSLLGVEEAMDREGVEFDRLELFLTGKGNFREQVATIRGYKSNRKDNVRPVHYRGIRRYMRERWDATVVKGYEADDALAMVAHEHGYDGEQVILVSADKDLKTVPGRHYNPRKKAWSVITPQEALLNFYGQVLTGDTVDAVCGCFKMGPKGAAELLTGLNDATEEEIARAVLLAYEQSLGKKGCPYVDAEAAMIENGRLLHMCRSVEETTTKLWTLPWYRA
jgi:DNA polymerase-1